jgi:hypothetical protein
MTTRALPIYDTEISVPRLTVAGYETRSFRWDATVGSAIISAIQLREVTGVRRYKFWIHRPSGTWRVQVAATPEGFRQVSARAQAVAADPNMAGAVFVI